MVGVGSWQVTWTVKIYKKRTLRRHKGTCNLVSLPYLDEDGGMMIAVFYVKVLFSSMDEKKAGRSSGIDLFPHKPN